ncbi:MAG: gliding motility-associated protein GldE [Prolixibacteraceae bacterium]|nr:gliding motility-associated protein GldE [Prolixibacteraceae bacterium]MBN2772762.1 gliding motility-associated protein GldE [Prolixibacteraceae bacterium]
MGGIIILLLLTVSALISGSEVAYFALSPKNRIKLSKSKTRLAKVTLKNLENPEKLLATILVANNFVNVGVIVLSSFITSRLIDFGNSQVIEFLFQVVLITFILLLIGEIVPKVYATHHGLGFAKFMSVPLNVLGIIFSPISSVLIKFTSVVNKRLSKHKKNLSISDLSQALELTSDQEISEDKEILEGIVKFGNKKVAEIMKSRVDVIAIDIKTPFDQVVNIIKKSGFSRIPVYSDSFDQINGILYIKDLLSHAHKGNSFKWQSLIRPPFYVPETKGINTLLEEFRKRKVHLAVVVDEYGGSAGIVTLEDILEEIVGEIIDEYDEEEKLFTKISDKKYIFDGKTMLFDFYRAIGSDENIFNEVKGDADTLAGLILELKGEIPELNDKISCKNFIFTINAVNNRRIEKIGVEIQ